MPKDKQPPEQPDLLSDLQRVQADFVNYRRRVEEEKQNLAQTAKAATIIKLLPLIDDIERAIAHAPQQLMQDKWVQGVTSLTKNLNKSLSDLGISRIDSAPGTPFDPNQHEAVSMDDSQGETELVSEELRAGYKISNHVIRPAMVRVTKGSGPSKNN